MEVAPGRLILALEAKRMLEDSSSSNDAMSSRFPFLSIDVSADEVEEAGALLFELGAIGVEERDGTTLVRGELGKVTLVGSFESERDARSAMEEMPAAWSPRVTEVVGDAWRDEWKKHFEPFRMGGGIVVRPPWRSFDAAPGEHVLQLEPGRAFGTGLHETTSLCADFLTEFREVFRSASVLDVGCGSGILGLVALVRGAAHVRAIDVDVEAVAVTRENAQRNGMTDRIEVDDTPLVRLGGAYPTIVANIEAAPLVDLASALMARLASGGLVILSGLLAPDVAVGQLDSIRLAYGALREQEVRRRGEWLAVALRG
jgi:ribosomal protein L11 methyltransferase